ncbi:uncharacterized protein [Dysidea avara]|uniref:uncharacterized protein n=1 Tax=Dysidea avara TaxID=196820 RepID=UPI00332E0982
MWCLPVLMLLVCTFSVQSYELPKRTPLQARDIRHRCCQNHWTRCCKRYPWEENRESYQDDRGSAADIIDGSGVMRNNSEPLTDKPYCLRFSKPFYKNYYGDMCVNNYVLLADVRQTRNIIEEYHRCVRVKDPEFLDRLVKLEDELRPGGDRCCRKHEMEGLIFGVIYSRLKLEDKLAALQRDYERQTKGRRVPCLNYGHWQAIEDRMADLVWNMGIYIECAEELECPRF